VRIAFLLTQDLDSAGGAGRFFPLAKALNELGHDVYILALHPDYPSVERRRFVKHGVCVSYVGQMHVRKPGNTKIYYNTPQLLWIAFLATFRLFQAAWKVNADIIHVCKTQPMNGLAAWLIHILRRTPVYLDSDDYEAAHNYFSAEWQRYIVASIEDRLPLFASGITVNTSFIANRFVKMGYPPDKIRLVPNAVDRQWYQNLQNNETQERMTALRSILKIEESDRVIVYIGSLRLMSHAVDLLLQAFSQVLAREPQALLLFVGGGEDNQTLREMVEKSQLTDRVRFVGRVPAEEILLYYRLGEVSVDPRRDTLPVRSSLSLKLIESIVAGVPCITTDVGDRRELVGCAGMAVPPGDVSALADGLLSVLQDDETALRMREAAEKMREDHFWDRRVERFIDVYS
jgi:glycosyltransferase involved in cell wall biosynthesis